MKTVDFSETIAARGVKAGRVIEFMKVGEDSRSRPLNDLDQGVSMTLAQGHLHMKIKTCFSQKPLGQF